MVNFPNSLDTWSDVTDDVEVVDDAHMNDAHNSIIELEKLLNLLHSTVTSWKTEKDYITGLEVDYVSATECTLTTGYAAINGKIVHSAAVIELDITSDLRSGESEEEYKFYYIYIYVSGASVLAKFSAIAPNADFSHPNETGWRAITGIPNVAWNFAITHQYGEFLNLPSLAVYAQGPSGSFTEIDLSPFIPNFSEMAQFINAAAADASLAIQVQTACRNGAQFVQCEIRLTGMVENDAMSQTIQVKLYDTSIWSIAAAGSWVGYYLTGVRLKRRRS